MRKIAILGLETSVGALILNELMAKDYVITAMAKNPFDLPGSPLIIACDGELKDVDVVSGHVRELENDVFISGLFIESEENPMEALKNLVKIAKKSAVKKLIFLGHSDDEKEGLDIPATMEELLHDKEMKSLDWIAVDYSSKKLQGRQKDGYGISTDLELLEDSGSREPLSMEGFAKAFIELINQDEFHHQKVTIY